MMHFRRATFLVTTFTTNHMNMSREALQSFVASTVKSLDTLGDTATQKQPVITVAKSKKLKTAQIKNQKVSA